MVITEEQTQADVELIKKVANKLSKYSKMCRKRIGEDVEEYIGIGYIGILKAHKNYTKEKGDWRKYAEKVIKDAIVKFAIRSRIVVIPFQASFQAWKITNGMGTSKKNTLSEKIINNALEWFKEGKITSINHRNEKSSEQIHQFDNEEAVKHAIKDLNPQTKEIIKNRYGLNNYEIKTFKQIGDEMGVTKQRVQKIESNAIKEMRKKFD